ncbi:hypothetical protein ASE48_22530 [Mycobacterium sp. Root265]|uniref:hypothetical protein n=1 Tax=Mycobacterium sp. Root265 TaxID=1736504 RepID=UPI00070F3AAB|nr:hypothetical protein [Mycobacterium sp. Root265]KRD19803.1 hypothetical protein ASE48_22530 [Mycobacterium sp. Root265]
MAGKFGVANSATVLRDRNDRVPLDQLWQEIQDAVALYSAEVDVLTGLLTYRTTNAADAMPQSLTPGRLEIASEHGVPIAIRPEAPHDILGYTLRDYDIASRLTRFFCRDASASQIRAAVTRMLEADRATVQATVLQRMFSPAQERNEFAHQCLGAYDGTSNSKPPDFMGKTFTNGHAHQIATGSTDLDSEDLELAAKHVTEHGYGLGGGRGQLVAMFNPEDVEDSALTSWRAGVTNANSKKARFDFIPSGSAPAFLTAEHRVGAAPPDDIDGVPVLGSYGKTFVVSSELIPAGYFAIASTHGVDHQDNAIGFREHPDESWQGFRMIEGNVERDYPIIESYGMRSFGVGVRRRGAFVVCQLTAGTYTAPTEFAL